MNFAPRKLVTISEETHIETHIEGNITCAVPFAALRGGRSQDVERAVTAAHRAAKSYGCGQWCHTAVEYSTALGRTERNHLMPSDPNFMNRTLWVDDNLTVLRGLNSECVDLIYLDPPFNTQRIYNAPFGSKAAGAKFDDTWTMDGVKTDWAALQEAADPAMYHTIVDAGLSAGEPMQAYLSFMALRMHEMHRVLKPTGSLYLHCDPTASHYLKQLLDCIFGRQNFRNEIVWYYKTGGTSKRWFGRKHDLVLFYSKSKNYTFNPQKEKSYLAHKYGFSNVTILEDDKGQHTVVGMRDVWDIPALRGNQREATGWPTQKPLALLEPIIRASSNIGDLVLDPFCGCATAMVAAERLGRRWAGIDIDRAAVGVTQDRLQNETDAAVHNVELHGWDGDQHDWREGPPPLHVPSRPPTRTDSEAPKRSPRIRQIRWAELGTGDRRACPGCERRKYFDDFDLDHIQPSAKGGLNADENLQLLCSSCNRIKGGRLTMTELRQRLLEMRPS